MKSEAEILRTLDEKGRHRGLQFTAEMRPFFGRRARVVKRVENIFLEESHQRRSLKNTVLLEGMHCHGENFNCDRYCFLFWREQWLRRAGPPAGSGAASSPPPLRGE